MEITVEAPSNVKMFGEHSVVYGGPCLAAATPPYAKATVVDTNSGTFEIVLQDLNSSASFDEEILRRLYEQYGKRDTNPKPAGDTTPTDLAKYIAGHPEIKKEVLPFATIAARIFAQQGGNLIGKKATIHSDVPIGKGFASSAVCSTALTVALLKATGKQVDDQTAIDISRDGERIVHGIETGGRLDVGPIFLGGFATFSASNGIQSANITTPLKIVVFDVGPKPPTAEQVAKVRARRAQDTEGTDKILRQIDECVLAGMEATRTGNIQEVGHQMSRNHNLLTQLGVSSEKLDKAISTAMASGALGAKLCGGGGGGMGIALVSSDADAAKVIEALKNTGFEAYSANVTLKGAKDLVKTKARI